VRPDHACGHGTERYSAELFKFSTVSMEWTNLDAAVGVKGTGPSAGPGGGGGESRKSHATFAVGTDLYLFGGDVGAEFFKFSIVSMEWTNLDAAAGVNGTGPSARYGHTMSAVGTDLYLFGGDRDIDISGKGGSCWWSLVCSHNG
jgi:hypothetical protein